MFRKIPRVRRYKSSTNTPANKQASKRQKENNAIKKTKQTKTKHNKTKQTKAKQTKQHNTTK